MKTKKLFLLLGIAIMSSIGTPHTAMAQKEFTLEELNFGGKNYRKYRAESRQTTWWGNQLVRIEKDYCAKVNPTNGKEEKLFDLQSLNQWLGLKEKDQQLHGLYGVRFVEDKKPYVNISHKGKRYVVDFKNKKVVRQWELPQSLQAEDYNSVSGATAFVSNHQLFVSDAQGKQHKITNDGSRQIVYGQSVHRDEFGINRGLFWSPSGEKLAFYRMDQSMVADFPLFNVQEIDWQPASGESRMATADPTPYPMAGETSHKVTVGIYDLKTQKTIYLKAGDPTDRYFTNIAWNPNNTIVYMFELNRDQNDCRLVAYDAQSGEKIKELYREQHDKYVEPRTPIKFLPWDNRRYIMQSQKDGYNHFYLCDSSNGNIIAQITNGEWVVMDMLGFNEKEKSIIYVSNEASPIQRNLWSVSIEDGRRTLLDSGKGYHYGSLNSDGTLLVDNYTEPTVPRKIDIIKVSDKPSTYNWLTAANPWAEFKVPQFTSGSIKAADGTTDLYWRMVKPHNFDPNKKYPTIVYVYGGPHAHNVDASWNYGSRSWETYMAQKGYILFILDNRGSENRGRAFEQATFRQLGQIEMQDQMRGVKYLKSLPFVDQNRMGVHGWSFGGFMTISLITNYPETFKVGVAGGPVIDWKWYEAMYGERYMDTPESNPEGYAKTSLIPKAKDLKGKLQIITGLNDPVVLPQHCYSFLKACIAAGTQPDFYVYPGQGHNMMGHQSVHLHERITQYFEDYLK